MMPACIVMAFPGRRRPKYSANRAGSSISMCRFAGCRRSLYRRGDRLGRPISLTGAGAIRRCRSLRIDRPRSGFSYGLRPLAGAVWSKLSWGAYWNWDPRQTSIVALLLIYIAYVSLYSALHGNPNRSRIVSAYLVLATVTVPFFMFVVPRVFPSLHPNPIINPERRILLETSMKITLGLSIIAHTLLYAYLLDLKRRLAALREKTERD
jgi:hypothetical protein